MLQINPSSGKRVIDNRKRRHLTKSGQKISREGFVFATEVERRRPSQTLRVEMLPQLFARDLDQPRRIFTHSFRRALTHWMPSDHRRESAGIESFVAKERADDPILLMAWLPPHLRRE